MTERQRNYRPWSCMEDAKLVEALVTMVNTVGFKADNGFKSGYLLHIENALKESLPNSGILGKPHVESRIKTMKKDWQVVYDMVYGANTSGFGYDSLTQCVTAEAAVWEAYIQANIVRYNEENLMKLDDSTREAVRSQLSSIFSKKTSITTGRESSGPLSLSSTSKDLEMPMPPLALVPLLDQNIRPCNVSDVLSDLVGAVEPLAHKQQRVVQRCELSPSLEVAVEESALRQALSNLIEGALLRTNVGGMVEIVSTSAPAGGALIIIDDDGPDMHYMTQMHSLTPFGADLLSKGMVEDNMTWNFIAGLTVAREILENYGCVLRVISPRCIEAALGAGGTRIEIWLPSFPSSPNCPPQAA